MQEDQKKSEGIHILQDQLRDYCGSGICPMHMPGHKRALAPVPGLPYDWDLTEVEGVDDLHHAEGILKAAMDRTRDLVGSRRTWYLVGGSTCGNLAMMYAALPKGSEVIIAGNCHKSVFHGAELLDLKVHWLMPEAVPEFDIAGSVRKERVEELLLRYPASRAVLLTSPTYEGIVSDIRGISEIVHREGKLLLVDEAHGAHFGLFRESGFDGFPDSAVHLGADVVVQSAHKTLPSLTQTAFLHLCSERIREEAIEQGLSVFETSSPSYPLLASLDGCTGLLRKQGKELFENWLRNRNRLWEQAAGWKNLCILGQTGQRFETPADAADFASARYKNGGENPESLFRLDPGKLLIRDARGRYSGKELAELLRKYEKIEPEMCCGQNVLYMTSCADTEENWERLTTALDHLNRFLVPTKNKADEAACRKAEPEGASDEDESPGGLQKQREMVSPEKRQVLSLSEAAGRALHGDCERISLSAAEGRISAEYVMAYPPGIPILVPGERIGEEEIQKIRRLLRESGHIQCSAGGEILDNAEEIYVI